MPHAARHSVAAGVLNVRAAIPASDDRAGLGVRLSAWMDRPLVRVAGGLGGHGILLSALPEEDIAVVVVTNNANALLSDVPDFIFRRLLSLRDPPRRTGTPAVDATVVDALARVPGTYRNGAEILEIILMDGRPVLKSGDLTFVLQPLAGGGIGALTQGRVALQFRLIHDANGRPYLWLSDRAFALDP